MICLGGGVNGFCVFHFIPSYKAKNLDIFTDIFLQMYTEKSHPPSHTLYYYL